VVGDHVSVRRQLLVGEDQAVRPCSSVPGYRPGQMAVCLHAKGLATSLI
jgi:hypothetical protein